MMQDAIPYWDYDYIWWRMYWDFFLDDEEEEYEEEDYDE